MTTVSQRDGGHQATVHVQISQAPAPAQAVSGGGLFEHGMSRMIGKLNQSAQNRQRLQQQLAGVQAGIVDDLSSYRLKLAPVASRFFIQANEQANWTLIGAAWRHVGGSYRQFYELMEASGNARRMYFQRNCPEDMKTNVLLKYFDLIHSSGVGPTAPSDQALLMNIQQQGIHLGRLQQMVKSEYKDNTALLQVDQFIKSFFNKHGAKFEGAVGTPINDVVSVLTSLGFDYSDQVYDFKTLLDYIMFVGRAAPSLYGKLVEMLADSTPAFDPNAPVTLDTMFKGAVQISSVEIHEEEMKNKFLEELATYGTDEEKYAVIFYTGGRLMPKQQSQTLGATQSFAGAGSSYTDTPTFPDGYHFANIFSDLLQQDAVVDQIYSNWPRIARLSGISDSQADNWRRAATQEGDSLVAPRKFLQELRDKHGDAGAEIQLYRGIKQSGLMGVVSRIWTKT
ncbi:hypothetical protein E1189_16945 [Sansalvadorimonas verongulae]|nr:hypothetical protein [Sansalvadorimonas verongulae]